MLQTALHDWHVSHKGRMVPFAGWEMPIQFTSIVEEHHAVRHGCGLFDIAHMGRLWFRGTDHVRLLDHLLTNHVERMQTGQVRYSLMCRKDGGILDDVLVYRFDNECLLVVNASNRKKIVDWIEMHREGHEVDVTDSTTDSFMLAIQGPRAEQILQLQTPAELSKIRYYRAVQTEVCGIPAVLSRTGYTGEDGFEVTVPNDRGVELWETLLEAGAEQGITACGLGCRDTLRLEAAMPLYGHEMDESMDPLTAGLAFGVRLEKPVDFLGKDALQKIQSQPRPETRIGIQLQGKRIAREGAQLMHGNEAIGRVTSGTFSPTMQVPIAMGYVAPRYSEAGTELEVEVRGRREPARVVPLPFYKR